MPLTQTAQRRPVTVAMFFLGIALLGLVALRHIPIDFLPAIQIPELMVQTGYPGASAAEVEAQVTDAIESTLGTVSGVRHSRSISREGMSLVRLEFYWGTRVDYALLEVREKLDAVRGFLPEGVERPTILRIDPSTEAIMTIAISRRATVDSSGKNSQHKGGTQNRRTDYADPFQRQQSSSPALRPEQASPNLYQDAGSLYSQGEAGYRASPPAVGLALPPQAERELAELREFADLLVRRRLEQIDGIAQAVVAGGAEREIQVAADPDRLAAHRLGLEELRLALQNANVHYSGGTLRQGVFRYAFRTISELEDVAAIGEVALRTPGGQLVRIADLAQVREGFAERQGLTRLNGEEAILLFVRKEAGANTVAVSDRVQAVLELLRHEYPVIEMQVIFAQAGFIRQSISDIEQAIFWGALLAFLVLFLFLRDTRYPLLIGLATPFSILGTIVLMYFAGISFNIISLTGLALGIGMVGDNAIIVVENYSRLREQGLGVRAAVLQGAQELNLTVTAATLTNVAVFLPVIFVRGIAQKLFLQMSLTMTFALLASLLVAITLVPALLVRLGSRPGRRPLTASLAPLAALQRHFARLYSRFLEGYLRLLRWCLRHRAQVLLLTTLISLAAGLSAFFIDARPAPDIDQSRFAFELKMARGTAFAVTMAASARIEALLLELPCAEAVVADIGISTREDYFSLLQADLDRSRIEVKLRPGWSVEAAVAMARRALESLQPELDGSVGSLTLKRRTTTFERILQPGEEDVEIRVLGRDLAMCARIARELEGRLRRAGGLADLQTVSERGGPELRIQLHQDRLGRYGLEASGVIAEVSAFLRGTTATWLADFDRRVPVRLGVLRREGENPVDRVLRQPLGPVPLSELAEVRHGEGLSEIYHDNLQRVVLLRANTARLGLLTTVSEIKAVAAAMPLPTGYAVRTGGQVEEMADSFRSLLIIILLAFFLVYMILASEYESVLYPLVVLLTTPLALVGAILAIWAAGQSYNIMSIIGLVIMLGAIDNDTVIAIDLIIANRRSGMALHEAVLEGMRRRLRPIVMSTLTTVLGLIPLLFGAGTGLELAAAISYPIAGGLLASTLAAMFVDPVLYTWFDRIKESHDR